MSEATDAGPLGIFIFSGVNSLRGAIASTRPYQQRYLLFRACVPQEPFLLPTYRQGTVLEALRQRHSCCVFTGATTSAHSLARHCPQARCLRHLCCAFAGATPAHSLARRCPAGGPAADIELASHHYVMPRTSSALRSASSASSTAPNSLNALVCCGLMLSIYAVLLQGPPLLPTHRQGAVTQAQLHQQHLIF